MRVNRKITISEFIQKFFLLLICISFFNSMISQNISDALLCKFVNKTLHVYFEDSMMTCKQKKDRRILIETNINTDCLITKVNDIHFIFLHRNQEQGIDHQQYLKLLKKGIGNKMFLYSISYKKLSADTIDINISGSYLYRVNKKEVRIELFSGGTMGYIPQGRFILDTTNKEWNFMSEKMILEYKILKENEYIENIIKENRNKNKE